jgi:copper chaperone
MKTQTLQIDGMSCQHCVMELRKQLSKLDITIKNVQIGSAEITYNEEKVTQKQLEQAVIEAGYILKN